jgi:hypothetical protein
LGGRLDKIRSEIPFDEARDLPPFILFWRLPTHEERSNPSLRQKLHYTQILILFINKSIMRLVSLCFQLLNALINFISFSVLLALFMKSGSFWSLLISTCNLDSYLKLEQNGSLPYYILTLLKAETGKAASLPAQIRNDL